MATSAILSPTVYDFSGPPFTHSITSNPTSDSTSSTSTMLQRPQPKPKLSLNTTTPAAARTFGRNTTALRLDTLSASSPTVRNTYTNAYDPVAHAGSDTPLGTARLRVTTTLSLQATSMSATSVAAIPSSRVTPAASRDASPKRPIQIPYKVSLIARSILVNSPHAKRGRPLITPVVSDTLSSDRFSSCRSPSSKKVCFRDPVSEDIWTKEYTAKHSDLRSRSVSPAIPHGSGLQMTPIAPLSSAKHPAPRLREMAAPRQQQQQHDNMDDEGEVEPVVPKIPIAGRCKKERQWVWTIPEASTYTVMMPGTTMPDSDSEEDLAASLGESVTAAGAVNLGKLDDGDEDSWGMHLR